jgi:hypothetical protein
MPLFPLNDMVHLPASEGKEKERDCVIRWGSLADRLRSATTDSDPPPPKFAPAGAPDL